VSGGVYFPNENFATLPHYPNYRLGPLKDSSCDTLGLQPLPLAWWRWDRDTTELQVVFSDHSCYEPLNWHWDFGDGYTSTDTCPVHRYALPGTYQVCMSVCNAYGCDTMCREVEILLSGSEQVLEIPNIKIYPNPSSTQIYIDFTGSDSSSQIEGLQIVSINGQLLQVYGKNNRIIDISALNEGVYILQIELAGGAQINKRVLILR
jgi:hypothetical protein